jgi:hypothetical protein
MDLRSILSLTLGARPEFAMTQLEALEKLVEETLELTKDKVALETVLGDARPLIGSINHQAKLECTKGCIKNWQVRI